MKLKQKLHQFNIWYFTHKKITIPVSILLVLVLIGGGIYVYAHKNVSRINPNSSGKAAEPAIKFIQSPLTGTKIREDIAKRPITGVMIENSPEARPQSGLKQAGVVFEAIAEGGITRFLALYLEDKPKLIGPVRSLRPYYLDWAMGFDSSVAHVGGSEEALRLARNLSDFRDLDQFSGANYFFRSTDRFAPHNVYTRSTLLDNYSKAKKFDKSKLTSLERLEKKGKPANKNGAKKININYSSALFNVSYNYNKTKNNYTRYQGGSVHTDRESGSAIIADVVVVMKMNWSVASSGHSVYGTTQGGEAIVFQNGDAIKGKWTKAGRTSQIMIKNSEGEVIKLNPGRTWFSALPKDRGVSY